ncbi:unnamed protein product [Symbiodinium microadriaticum]|nr:unnamed protein product [Symbiodinium microadriaticum]
MRPRLLAMALVSLKTASELRMNMRPPTTISVEGAMPVVLGSGQALVAHRDGHGNDGTCGSGNCCADCGADCAAGLAGPAFGTFDFGCAAGQQVSAFGAFGFGNDGASAAASTALRSLGMVFGDGGGDPLLRGGSKLLLGLQQILEEVDGDDEEEEDSNDAWLRAALVRLVERQPKNLLQELKSLVKQAGRKVHRAMDEDYGGYEGDWHEHWHEQAEVGWTQQLSPTLGDEWWTGWQQDASGWWFDTGGQRAASAWARDAGSSWPSSARTVLYSQAASTTAAPSPARHEARTKKVAKNEWQVVQSRRQQRQQKALDATRSWHVQQGAWAPPAGHAIGHVTNAQDLGHQLDVSSGVAWVMETDDVDEVRMAVGMVEGAIKDDDRQSLRVVFKGDGKQLEEAGIAFGWMTVPGMVNGALRLRKWPVASAGSEKTLAHLITKTAETIVVQRPPPSIRERRASTFVVRCECDRKLAPIAWKHALARPATVVRQWARAVGIKQADILDTFSPRQVGQDRVVVMLRVLTTEAVQGLVRASGRSGGEGAQASVWFADVLGDKAQLKLPDKVQWISWDSQESWEDYGSRVRKLAGTEGVALGTHQLGVRMWASDKRFQPQACAWRLRGMRNNWDAAETQDLLLQLGFVEPVIEQKVRGKGVEWIFKARREDSLDSIQRMLDWGGDGEDLSEVTVVKEARRRRGLAATALRTERVVNFTAKPADRPKPRSRPAASGPVPKPATPTVAAKALATTALPSDAQTAVNDTATPSDAKKRGRDDADATDSMEVETPVEWRPSEGRVVENVGEGNCLWHCLAAFSSTPAVKRSHRQIRQYTVHCMRERSDELRPIWEAMGKFNDAGKPSQFEWEDYLSDQNTHGQWSGAFEVAAWAVATNHRVWITTDTGKLHLINPDIDLENAWVALRYQTQGHYELWAGAREEEFWARACDLSVQGRQHLDELLRGGGHQASDDHGASDDEEPQSWECDVCHCVIRISLRANLTRCSKLGLTRQVAGGTTSAKARVQQMKVAALPQGPTRHVATHVVCPFPRRCRGDKAPLRLIWGGCAKCARQFEYFAASKTRCYPEERAKHLRANVTVWKKYRVGSASLWSELVRAWGLTSAEALKLDQWATKRFRKAMDGVPPLTTSLWQRDLCAENIEPNPGPCSLTYLNVNGLAGAFRALQRLPCSNLGVVCLAETQANQRQHRDLQQRLASLGFRSFGVQGRVGTDASGRAFARGGLLVAVKGHVKARCVNVHSSARGDMVVVDFLGFFLGFVWQREAEIPQGGLDDQVLLLKGLAEERLVPWAAVGDWNLIPALHPAVASDSLAWHAPLDDVGVPMPSRFGYTRCIDYLVGVVGGPWHSFCHSPLVLSDHKALCFAIDFPSLVEAPCYLRPTACYKKPAHLSACQWSQLVSKSWQLQVPPAPGGNPDSEWRAFCDVLETTLQDAAREAGHAIHTGATRAKGSTPVLMKSGEIRRFTSTPTSFQERKLEKLLGRLYELERQERQGPPDPGLADAVHRTWPQHLGRFGGCAAAIRVVRARLQQVRDSGMRQRISHWRQRLATGGRAASRWLATSQVVSPHTLLPPAANQNGGEAPLPASSAPECLNELRRYWNTIWQRPGTPEELVRLREGRLSRPRGQSMEGDWHISPELLVQHLKAKLPGSAGADGWRADELLAFPMATWRCFLDLWHSWCQQGAFPSCWRHSRQIFLPKAEVLDGALEVDRMRPICVQPVLCRALSSCMAQLCRDWVLTKVDACTFGALRGRGVEAAVLLLDAALGKDSIMFSLDFRKCFDMMSPELAIGILEHEGLHPQWARHLHFMWIDQRRWLQLGAWTDSDSTLVPNSVPQGCAMAPLALVCLLAEASRDVPRVAAEAGFRQSIFIDDRAFVTSSVAAALRAWRGWTGWSHRLGLAENGQKLCVLCTHPQKRHELVQGGVPVRALAEEARVLGVDFSLGSTAATTTRDQRLLKAAAILQRLANLPVGQATKRLLFRTRASPLASWGAWLSGDPVRESAKLTTQLKRCLGQVSTMGSRDLWLLLEGHWSAPAFTAAVSAAAAYGRAKAYWDAQGLQLPPARWFRRVSGFFEGLGFRHVLPDTWSHPFVGDFVMAGPQPRQWIGRMVHLLRECWRCARFAAFVEHNRRDSRALRGHVVYDPLQVSAARKMYLQASGDERAVMHGSALSSAVYGVMSGQGVPSTCRWCPQGLMMLFAIGLVGLHGVQCLTSMGHLRWLRMEVAEVVPSASWARGHSARSCRACVRYKDLLSDYNIQKESAALGGSCVALCAKGLVCLLL